MKKDSIYIVMPAYNEEDNSEDYFETVGTIINSVKKIKAGAINTKAVLSNFLFFCIAFPSFLKRIP